MNKKTKLVLGVAAVGAVAYYLWNKSKTTTAFANQIGGPIQPIVINSGSSSGCVGYQYKCPNGKTYCETNSNRAGAFPCPDNDIKSSVITKNQMVVKNQKPSTF
jgi:hypothetical protein